MMYDMTFCMNFNCGNTDCVRHQINTPQDEAVLTYCYFSKDENGKCNYYKKRRNYEE